MKVMLVPSALGAGPLQYLTTLLVNDVVAVDAAAPDADAVTARRAVIADEVEEALVDIDHDGAGGQ